MFFNRIAVVKNSHNEKNDGKFSYGNFTQSLFHSSIMLFLEKMGSKIKKIPCYGKGFFNFKKKFLVLLKIRLIFKKLPSGNIYFRFERIFL
jgi:hypothetical protein